MTASLQPPISGPISTISLINLYKGWPISTTRRFSQPVLSTALRQILNPDGKRIHLWIQNQDPANSVVIQHSYGTNGEVGIMIGPLALYLEDWDDDDDQVTTEFWAYSSAGTPTLSVCESVLV